MTEMKMTDIKVIKIDSLNSNFWKWRWRMTEIKKSEIDEILKNGWREKTQKMTENSILKMS